ncbi:transcription initiation factor TFIID subunit 7-like [Panonychus citri]|uniref:transcription initiation factor TFIID subunit 7-like n=1 Tax=Panonychus citri TaxID=50023 RepID=UPI002306E0CB|nr:transcription initiation factor TFIID subunit 7-like [Panonychus citri]
MYKIGKTVDKSEIPIESSDGNTELESQFILRLPSLPAAALRSVVASGVLNLKDRLNVQLENDMRHGTVRFDGWVLPAKVVDLPSIIESLKTLDGKTFYKTADICQMMICKEEMEEERPEGEESKKKDGKDKKFLYPHGVTPPLKNVRKKRFRKTLKKKFFDVPEIEKEVKRLFRTDSEAIHVRYEVETKDEKSKEAGKQGVQAAGPSGLTSNNSQSMDIVEHDLFGEVLSSSDEEDTRAQDTDEGSRLSSPPIREASSSQKETPTVTENKYVTEFTPGMLTEQENRTSGNLSFDITSESSSAAAAAAVAALEEANEMGDVDNTSANGDLVNRLNELQSEIATIREKRQIQEAEIAGIDNAALVSRFMVIIDEFKRQEFDKRRQYEEILKILDQQL